MSNFHFDLSLKLPQGEVHDFSGEEQKFSGEVQNDLGGAHLSTKSGHARDCIFFHVHYTGCIKKKVIELQRAIVSELLCV
jgi:hypothetical protein